MKNLNEAQLSSLRAFAESTRARLPALSLGNDGALSDASRAALRQEFARVLRRHRAVGCALVLCLPNGRNETFFFGHARLSPKTPVTAGSCIRMASVSKLVMSFGALSLTESGLLSLDEDISRYLGYPVRHPKYPDLPVTMRMLLTHTSGITDSGKYGTVGLAGTGTLRELLCSPESWRDVPPGDSFSYSNLGAGVAGVVMERAAGMPFEQIMQERVFAPLGIRASYDPRRILPHDDLADGYSVRWFLPPRRRYNAAALCARPPEPFDPEHDYLIAAGRMITDADGLAALVRLLASADGMGVLKPESLAGMRKDQSGVGGIRSAGRGLNVAFLPDVFPGFSPVGHQGVAYGMCAELFADPAKNAGMGILTNGVLLDNSKTAPLMQAGFELLSLGFSAMAMLHNPDIISS